MAKDKLRIVGINFDHMHMGDLLRQASEDERVEIVGMWHHERDRPEMVADRLGLSHDIIYEDMDECMCDAKPDIAIICASTATHAEYTERVAKYDVHVMVEKPFAETLEQADRMIAAMEGTRGKKFAVNWPLAWYPPHRTTKRLIDEGKIGDVIEVHYYDGNRGPLAHDMDKINVSPEEQLKRKRTSWFYKKEEGGGSLQDYLGYGVTLGTWFNGGKKPIEVTTAMYVPEGLDVDEHSVTVVRYEEGLSKFETRWGAFNDPWVMQPQPKCGFVVVGTEGTIASYDYEGVVRLQTEEDRVGSEVKVDELMSPNTGPIDYFVHCVLQDLEVEGPLSVEVCRIGQQIVDSAVLSAELKQTVKLVDREVAAI
ncbi:Glucose--fructose oxidoreductase precursor [Poriferisphaera corsica]|uniref:Glucose--fructose oxidoreductase n=1 Tax=Poriferisphaera corsica TaxID=2528020 RepID=A0A517YUH8_9BACT|nr:Gfo/Idh/MocA family oxidoreductase [Poriferisphaera corsica]QDU33889.1 Glucose--fructose oxidoreductase precursor [Poriferisphaera corsica]